MMKLRVIIGVLFIDAIFRIPVALSDVLGATDIGIVQVEPSANDSYVCGVATSESEGVLIVAVGNPLAAENQGRVYTYDSEDRSSPQQVISLSLDATVRGFGSSLAFLGDLNGDQREELAIGAPGNGGASGGVVSVFMSDVASGSVRYVLCGYLAGPVGFGGKIAGAYHDTSAELLVGNVSDGTLEQFLISSSESGECEFTINPSPSFTLTDLEDVTVTECPVGSSGGITTFVSGAELGDTAATDFEISTTMVATADSYAPTAAPIVTATMTPTPPLPILETPTPAPTSPPPSNGGENIGSLPPGDDGSESGLAPSGPSSDFSNSAEEPMAIAPGMGGLPAPTILESEDGYTVQMQRVKPLLSLQQKRRAARRLSQRSRISKSRAMKLLNDQSNYRLTYIISYSQVDVARRFSLIRSAYAAPARQRGSKLRQVRTRQNSLTLRAIRPGFTYRVSYRVQITLRQSRVVLGVTKQSPTVTFKAR